MNASSRILGLCKLVSILAVIGRTLRDVPNVIGKLLRTFEVSSPNRWVHARPFPVGGFLAYVERGKSLLPCNNPNLGHAITKGSAHGLKVDTR